MKKAIPTVRPSHPEAEVAEELHSPTVPQHALDIVRITLLPYLDKPTLNKVNDTILSVNNSKPEPAQDRFLSTEEIGELLHVSRVTIHRYKVAGKIRAHKLGRRNLYSLAEVMAVVKGKEVANV